MTMMDTRQAATRARRTAVPARPRAPRQLSLVDAIVLEAGCTPQKARQTVKFLRKVARRCSGRIFKYSEYVLSKRDLDATNGVHGVLDIIMPDDQTARPGSAHDMLNRQLLPHGSRFLHGKSRSGYCNVKVRDHVKVVP